MYRWSTASDPIDFKLMIYERNFVHTFVVRVDKIKWFGCIIVWVLVRNLSFNEASIQAQRVNDFISQCQVTECMLWPVSHVKKASVVLPTCYPFFHLWFLIWRIRSSRNIEWWIIFSFSLMMFMFDNAQSQLLIEFCCSVMIDDD